MIHSDKQLMADAPNSLMLTDGVIFLRPLAMEDAADHLAGEDEEMAKWLSGGRSTLASVEAFIRDCQENWRTSGARRAFGVFDAPTDRLIGFIEANLTLLDANRVNVSYGVFKPWRGQDVGLRALNLMGEYLRTSTAARQMALRIAPANTPSLDLAENAGFTFCGIFEEPEGRLARYVRDLKS